MKKLLFALAAAAGLMAFADTATAGGNANPFNAPEPARAKPLQKLFARQPLPAFQAAPWYLYFPYNAHFQTATPIGGEWYGPGAYGSGAANPYYPNPAYGPATTK